MISCRFPVTNENIFAIREGLKPSPEDNIYSICGGGDVPFMFIEHGAKVCAVDYNPYQLAFVEARIKDLKNSQDSDLSFFRSLAIGRNDCGKYLPNYGLRNEYFSNINPELVKNNLEHLTLKEGNFFRVRPNFSKFNKVYLSNSLFYDCIRDAKAAYNFLKKFNSGTKFYLTYTEHSISAFKTAFARDLMQKEIIPFTDLPVKDTAWNVFVFSKK